MTAVAGGVRGRPAPRAGVAPAEPVHWVGPLLVLIVGMFMTVLDSSIINVAIPTIQTQFGGSTSDVAWISTSYSLVLGVVVPTTAWLGDRFGLAKLYTYSLIGFALGSALCGLSWSLPTLITARVLQAIPGGILPAITMTMVYRIVPPDKIGSAMGMYGLGVITAPALGPTLGGYLVEYLNWRLIFYINVPVAAVGVVLAFMMLPPFPQMPTYRFDVLGFLTVASGLVLLLLACSEGGNWGWTSYPILALFLAGLLCLALFVVIELEVDHPLLDLGVFRCWPYLNSLIIISVQTTGLFATLFFIPVFLQLALGLPALDAGLLVLPQALMMAVVAPISGRIYDRIGPRWLVFSGLLIASFATYLLTGLNPDVTRGQIILWTCIRSVGVGLAMMSVTASGIGALNPRLMTSGTAINNVVQRVSAALGLAALSAMVTGQQAQLAADRYSLVAAGDPQASRLGLLGLYQLAKTTQLSVLANSYTNMFLVTTGITLVAAAAALFLRSGPAQRAGDASALAAD